ncbi:MAG TPA: hypothetical protein VHS96_00350 [Bacteroidia bacterium]|nr:hypothetical protein [Bacteroidia bacterium]
MVISYYLNQINSECLMMVVYEKGTNKYITMVPQIFDNGTMREYTLEELYPNWDHSKYGVFYVEDTPKYAVQQHAHWQLKIDKSGTPVGIEYRPRLTLKLSTNAPDTDGDGIPEILVKELGGTSRPAETVEITVQVMDGQKEAKSKEPVKLSVTGGTLSSRYLDMSKRGLAKVALTASHETVTITVTASAPGMDSATMKFEVLPFDDFNRFRGTIRK